MAIMTGFIIGENVSISKNTIKENRNTFDIDASVPEIYSKKIKIITYKIDMKNNREFNNAEKITGRIDISLILWAYG